MSAADNVAIARRFFADQDARKGETPEDLIGPGYSVHLPGMPPMDAAGHTQMGKMFWGAFPDLNKTIEDVFANDDHAAVRFTARGTHQGDLMGMPPTGKTIEVSGMAMLRIVDGKVTEFHEIFDQMAMMQQLGAIPSHDTA